MGPVRMFDLVQLGLREGVVEVFNSHLLKGDHVVKFLQLLHMKNRKEIGFEKTTNISFSKSRVL